MQQLEQLDENLWVHEDSLSMVAGVRLRLRMTVVKLIDGKLWIHSPTALSPELKPAIDALGQVGFIVGPNNAHNLWLREWSQAYPVARLYVSAKIPKKTALDNCYVLDELDRNPWQDDLSHVFLPGVELFNESVFLHLASKSLIVTDLIQNHSDPRPPGLSGLLSRWLFEPLGFKGVCIAPPLKMGFVIKGKAAFSSAIKVILDWNFERIIVTHGDIVEQDARQVFSQLCQRFLSA